MLQWHSDKYKLDHYHSPSLKENGKGIEAE